MDNYHIPVLLQTACNFLNIQKDEWYLDCTLGGGGHTQEILRRGGKVVGLDQDQDSLDYCTAKFSNELKTGRFYLRKSSFSRLDSVLQDLNITFVYGVLFDLGVSMHQLKTPNRGFSYGINDPLDMRMDQYLPLTAYSLISALSPKQLNQIFIDFGEIKNGFHLAQKICETKPDTTFKLVKIINNKNLLRPVFQALRIATNSELLEIESALPKAFNVLTKNGRLVVISFHSLEDRIVKNFMPNQQITKRPVVPEEFEINNNPASRSAKLRAFLKQYA